jgi:hypothetical protein
MACHAEESFRAFQSDFVFSASFCTLLTSCIYLLAVFNNVLSQAKLSIVLNTFHTVLLAIASLALQIFHEDILLAAFVKL